MLETALVTLHTRLPALEHRVLTLRSTVPTDVVGRHALVRWACSTKAFHVSSVRCSRLPSCRRAACTSPMLRVDLLCCCRATAMLLVHMLSLTVSRPCSHCVVKGLNESVARRRQQVAQCNVVTDVADFLDSAANCRQCLSDFCTFLLGDKFIQ